jgi:hypothetical protein
VEVDSLPLSPSHLSSSRRTWESTSGLLESKDTSIEIEAYKTINPNYCHRLTSDFTHTRLPSKSQSVLRCFEVSLSKGWISFRWPAIFGSAARTFEKLWVPMYQGRLTVSSKIPKNACLTRHVFPNAVCMLLLDLFPDILQQLFLFSKLNL